ncbi:MAG: ArnT family glycosyltransferase [Pirellulaceae bacterium]
MKRKRRDRRPRTGDPRAGGVPSPDAAAPAPVAHVGRREWTLVLLICLAGGFVRLAFPANMAVEHFDEGVYASNIWFGQELGYQYRLRQLYAPPLLPGLIEFFVVAEMLLFQTTHGPSDVTVMIPSLVAGCLTIPLVWWVVRDGLGPRAGIVASLLAATSDFQSLYSRTALTDVLLVLLLLMAIWLIERACTRGRLRTVVGAGVVSGLAWWAKYNGWLALSISLCGILWLALAVKRQRAEIPRYLGRWLLIAVIAAMVWCPVLYSLQSMGGYAAVAANHKTYIVGIEGWWESFVTQFGNLRHFDGALSCLGLAAAAMVAGCSRQTGADAGNESLQLVLRRPRLHFIALAAALCAIASLFGVSTVLVGLSLVGFAGRYLVTREHLPDKPGERPLAFWFLATWFFSLLLATPLYHPYPRLVLPWLCAAWMAGGLGLEEIARRMEKASSEKPVPLREQFLSARWRNGVSWACLITSLSFLAWSLPRVAESRVPAWQSRTGLKSMATDIVAKARKRARASSLDSNEVLVYVYGEPALFFHCRRQGLPLVGPVQNPQAAVIGKREAGCPAILATGPHAHHSPEFAAQWEASQGDFELLARYAYHPSDLVLLNRYPPRDLTRAQPRPREEIRLYVVK